MQIIIQNKELKINFSFWEKVWGMHSSFSIPLSHITEIKDGTPPSTWKELRAPGSFLPGVIKAGTYYTRRGKEFWYVTRGEKVMKTIELKEETYKRIVLGLDKHDRLSIETIKEFRK